MKLPEMVLTDVLREISGGQVRFSVNVCAHERHGTIARIGANLSQSLALSSGIEADVRKAMANFSIQYELEWAQ